MKAKRFKALATYLRIVADHMELRDWTVALDPHPPAREDCDGFVTITYGQRLAAFRFPLDFDTFPAERVRHVVVHELVHVVLDRVDDVVSNGPPDALGPAAAAILNAQWRVAVEHTTDHLTRVIEHDAPLIDWDWIAPGLKKTRYAGGRISYEPWSRK